MNILAPSILSADFCHLLADMDQTQQGGALYAHIDVMDGRFVPPISFGMPVIKSLRPQTDLFFDVHLMVRDPENVVAATAEAGADLITFHLEATQYPAECIEKIRETGKQVGISIKPKTPVEAVLPYLDQVDLVLLMTVEPGFGGQQYIPESTERIRKVRQYITERQLPVNLEVDGGIKLENVDEVLQAGANVIVAGSAVYGGDILKKTQNFMEHLQHSEA